MNIYLRIYKLYQRKIPIQQISATMNIPVKTIKDLIYRFESKGAANKDEKELEKISEPFLDHIVKKSHKYAILDFTGMLTAQFSEKINDALEEARQTPSQVLALKLEHIIEVDDTAMKIIMDFKEKLNGPGGKILVFLSPSDPVEDYISKHNIEESIKIFGTQSAFEEYSFKSVLDKSKK